MSDPIDEFLPTRLSLLGRLKDWGDQQSWQDFFDIYHRLIHSVALKAGLSPTEAQDVVQEAVSGKELLTLNGHGREVYAVAFSPDGQRIVTGSVDNTKVWEAATPQQVATWQAEEQSDGQLPAQVRAALSGEAEGQNP